MRDLSHIYYLQADSLLSEPPVNCFKFKKYCLLKSRKLKISHLSGKHFQTYKICDSYIYTSYLIYHLCCAVLSCSGISDSFWPHGPEPVMDLCPWRFSISNTGVGCHAILQWIFPTQGLYPDLTHWRQIPYQLIYQENAIYHLLYIIKKKELVWINKKKISNSVKKQEKPCRYII